MTPLPFTPSYRVTRLHTDHGWHLELQKRFFIWWRTLTVVEISLNSYTRYNHHGVEYWPCRTFNVKQRAADLWLEWCEKEKLEKIKIVI